MEHKTKCLIIGSGVAGCTAGIYTGRAGLEPIIICGEVGGQLATTNEVENFPGFENIKGGELTEKMRIQAEKCGAKTINDVITEVDVSKRPFVCKGNGNIYVADTIIVATGAKAKWLGVKGEEEYKGFGVSACAVCDGNFYKGKNVAVIGGGNTAVSEAIYLSKIAKSVVLIHRNSNFKAEKVLLKQLNEIENIQIKTPFTTEEILGDSDFMGKFVNGIKLKNNDTGEVEEIQLDGVFVAIGHKPCSDLFQGKLELNERGYIKTDAITKETSVKGIFACGDVQDEYHKQAIIACGTACVCALEVERLLASEKK